MSAGHQITMRKRHLSPTFQKDSGDVSKPHMRSDGVVHTGHPAVDEHPTYTNDDAALPSKYSYPSFTSTPDPTANSTFASTHMSTATHTLPSAAPKYGLNIECFTTQIVWGTSLWGVIKDRIRFRCPDKAVLPVSWQDCGHNTFLIGFRSADALSQAFKALLDLTFLDSEINVTLRERESSTVVESTSSSRSSRSSQRSGDDNKPAEPVHPQPLGSSFSAIIDHVPVRKPSAPIAAQAPNSQDSSLQPPIKPTFQFRSRFDFKHRIIFINSLPSNASSEHVRSFLGNMLMRMGMSHNGGDNPITTMTTPRCAEFRYAEDAMNMMNLSGIPYLGTPIRFQYAKQVTVKPHIRFYQWKSLLDSWNSGDLKLLTAGDESTTICIRNAASAKELRDGESAHLLMMDMWQECAQYGDVLRVDVVECGSDNRVSSYGKGQLGDSSHVNCLSRSDALLTERALEVRVEMAVQSQATAALLSLQGRLYADRIVEVKFLQPEHPSLNESEGSSAARKVVTQSHGIVTQHDLYL